MANPTIQQLYNKLFYLPNNEITTHSLTPKQRKHILLNNGTYYQYKNTKTYLNKLKPSYYKIEEDIQTGEFIKKLDNDYYYFAIDTYKLLAKEITPLALKECEKIDHNKYKRTTRLRKRITLMLKNNEKCYFNTLTFRPDYIAQTTQEERREAVRRFHALHSSEYVANIDFGTENETEHYHSITNCKLPKWEHGYYLYERISNNQKSIDRLPVYINKLSHHALKETAKGSNLIYSRTRKTPKTP